MKVLWKGTASEAAEKFDPRSEREGHGFNRAVYEREGHGFSRAV